MPFDLNSGTSDIQASGGAASKVGTRFFANRLDTALDADGDGIITAEEIQAEGATRGELFSAVTRETTKYALAQDYAVKDGPIPWGSTVKNALGPRNPHVLNTPFTAVALEETPKVPPSQQESGWWAKPAQEPSAAMLFEKKLGNPPSPPK